MCWEKLGRLLKLENTRSILQIQKHLLLISISLQDYNGDSTGSSFSSLIQGDIISLDQDGISQSWVIKSIVVNPGYYTFGVVPQNETRAQEIFAVQEKTVYFQTTPNPLTAGAKALLALLTDGSGKIKFPITITLSDLLPVVGLPAIGFPLNSISLEIGDFNALPKDSPLAKKIKDLEAKSGWNFQADVLDKIFKGKYPKLDYPKDPSQPKSEKLKAREELLALAKFVQMIFTSPGDFFKIIGNYLKLLLLPLQIVVGTISALFAAVIENPLNIFSLIAKFLTDPIGALGDLIADAYTIYNSTLHRANFNCCRNFLGRCHKRKNKRQSDGKRTSSTG
jgi:hypothetical protein